MLYRYAQSKGYDTTQGGMAIREYADFEQISGYAVEAMTLGGQYRDHQRHQQYYHQSPGSGCQSSGGYHPHAVHRGDGIIGFWIIAFTCFCRSCLWDKVSHSR